jgi:hypothetical protein
MTSHRPSHRFPSLVALAATATTLVSLGVTAPAHAGTYTVTGTCTAWTPWGTTSGQVAVFPACPSLVDRNVLGRGPASAASFSTARCRA